MLEKFADDEIDRIVDRVIENPTKAAKLKEALHTSSRSHRYGRAAAMPVSSSYDDSVEDLWDNVPV